jgi:hypothetical protein
LEHNYGKKQTLFKIRRVDTQFHVENRNLPLYTMKKADGDKLCAEVVVVPEKPFLSFNATCNTLKPWWCKLEQHWLMS